MKPVFFLSVFSLILFSSCNDYTTQICSPGIRRDISKLAGRYVTVINVDGVPLAGDHSVVIRHIAKGRYRFTEEGESMDVSACQIAGRHVLELQKKKTSAFTAMFMEMTLRGFAQFPAEFNEAELKKEGIPYTALPRGRRGADEYFSDLLIDNARISPTRLVNFLHPSGRIDFERQK